MPQLAKEPETRMTLAEIDVILQDWQRRSSAIAENLLALQSGPTYCVLTGTGGLDRAAVSGVTAARVEPALRGVHQLFEEFGLLQGVLEQAAALRRALPALFGGEAKGRELQRLLFTRSIGLRSVAVPVEERALVDGPESQGRMVSPEELLRLMETRFAGVREVLQRVDTAWNVNGQRLDRMEAEIARVAASQALPAEKIAADVQALRGAVEGWRGRAVEDPLGLEEAGVAEVEAGLARLSARLGRADAVEGEVRRLEAWWEECGRLHGEALRLRDEVKLKLVMEEGEPSPVDEAAWSGLGAWLGRLADRCDAGEVESVAVGLERWNRALTEAARQDRLAAEAYARRLALRGELRGRLQALQAKGRAVAQGSAAEDLERLLYSRPLDLQAAAVALAAFEQQLRGAAAVGGKG